MTEAEKERAAVITRIAEIAQIVAFQANVGGMETAGSIISYLAKHPDQIEGLLRDGVFATEHPLSSYPLEGCLTWHGMNGKIVSPEMGRRAVLIKKMGAAEHLKEGGSDGYV